MEARPTRRRGNIATLFSATILTLCLAAAVGEAAARYHESHRGTVPGTKLLLYYRHNRLRHAFVRGANYFGWLHVNAQGFRGSAPTALVAGGAFRIMAVGASTTTDEFVTRDDKAWPARLAARLEQTSDHRRIEVINAGVPGYILLDNLIRLQTELYRYHPDLLLLYHGHNELLGTLASAGRTTDAAGNATPDAAEAVAPWRYWLERHSLLYVKLMARWKAQRQAHPGAAAGNGPDWAAVIDSGAAGFGRDLDAFLAVARAQHIPVALMELVHVSEPLATSEADTLLAADWHSLVPSASASVVLEGYRRYNEVIRAAAVRNEVPLLRSTAFGLLGEAWYSPRDPIHFNDAGAGRMADRLAQSLRDAHLVP